MNDTINKEILRKKRKPLDSNGWMCRLQRWAFGIEPTTYYMGYCPLWWMTWVALLLSPFIGLIKGICVACDWLGEQMGKFTLPKFPKKVKKMFVPKPDKQLKEKAPARAILPSDRILREMDRYDFISPCDFPKRSMTLYEGALVWFSENPNWRETHLQDAIRRIAEAKAAKERYEEQQRENVKRRAENLAKLAKYAKWVVIPILAIVAIGIVVALGWGVVLLVISAFTWPWVNIGIAALMLLTIGSVVAGLVATLKYFVEGNFGDSKVHDGLAVILRPIGFTFSKLGGIISEGWELLVSTIKMLYIAECPMIEWGDTTEPIQKIQR